MTRLLIVIIILNLHGAPAMAELKDKLKPFDDYSFNGLQGYEVEDYVIEVEYGTIVLDSGTVYFAGEWNGRSTAAYFYGSGRFVYAPDDDIEKHQISRFYKTKAIDIEFDYVYFAFPPNSTIFDQLDQIESESKPNFRQNRIFKHARELPHREFYYNLPFQIYKSAIEGHDSFLFADMISGEYDHTVYSNVPYDDEPVSVYKFSPGQKNPQIVSSMRDNREPITDQFHVNRYEADVDICTYSKSSIKCKIIAVVHSDSLKCIAFSLPLEYKVDSVLGDASGFLKRTDRSSLHIELNKYYNMNDTLILEMYYQTNMFYHMQEFGVIQQNLTHWLPYHGFRQLSDYEINYRIDKGFSFLSVGSLKSVEEKNDKQVYHFKTDHPVAYVSFNYGLFDTVGVDSSVVPVNLYYLNRRHGSPIFGKNNVYKVADDVGEAFLYYHQNIASYQFDRLEVDAMAVGFGQGSPGMVHLAEITFERSSGGIDDKFRAHEVAHQWWGHMVSPYSYRDIWISEGFAEFSAAMYVLNRKGDVGSFTDILKDWRKNIINKGKLFGKRSDGYRAGAVVLGNRLRSETSPGDFEAIIYFKGAYVLNMLRYELFAKYGEDRIMELLSSFAMSHYQKLATTEDFEIIVENYLGDRAGQFMQQWVYDWRIPKIEKDYSIDKDGTVELKLTVSEMGPLFETAYPVRIVFNDNSFINLVYYLKAGENLFEYHSDKDRKIKSVEFNPNLDILEL